MFNYPIGVFDSGLGGLTVVKELIKRLPCEDIVYYGDTARVPYGTKSQEAIIRFSLENAKVLVKNKVKMMVVACHSSTSMALPVLKQAFDLPILGVIDPGVKRALEATRNKRVGIIATEATINSQAYLAAIKKLNPLIKVFPQACPLFVPLVEEGWMNKKVTLDIAREYLSSLKKERIDTLILGCTHYPLLKKVLKKVMGWDVNLIDSAEEVACQVKEYLTETGRSRKSPRRPQWKFLVSDKPQQFQKIARNFLGREIKVELIRE